MNKIREHIDDLRGAANLDISVLDGNSLKIMEAVGTNHTRTADLMEAMLEVVLHAKRHLNDPSWKAHKVNLKNAIAKLESHDG